MQFAYGERETMLYGRGVRMRRNQLDGHKLLFVYDGDGLQA